MAKNSKLTHPFDIQHEVDLDDEDYEERERIEQGVEQFFRDQHNVSTVELTNKDGQKAIPTLEWLKERFKTKSAVIRYLNSEGFSVKQIHKHLGIRPQHVHNVLKQVLKRGPNEDWHLGGGITPSALSGAEDE